MADTTQYTRDYTKWIEANHTTWQYTKDFTAWINKNYEKEIKSGKATLAKLQADKSVQERYTKETKNEPTESILSTLQANSDNQKKYTQTTGEEPIEIIRELKTSSKGKYGKVFRRNTYQEAQSIAAASREQVRMTTKKSDGKTTLTDRSEVTINSVFGKRGEKWQMHTTGSHDNKQIYLTSENNNWNFIINDWPSVEGQWNTEEIEDSSGLKDQKGNKVKVKNRILNWR